MKSLGAHPPMNDDEWMALYFHCVELLRTQAFMIWSLSYNRSCQRLTQLTGNQCPKWIYDTCFIFVLLSLHHWGLAAKVAATCSPHACLASSTGLRRLAGGSRILMQKPRSTCCLVPNTVQVSANLLKTLSCPEFRKGQCTTVALDRNYYILLVRYHHRQSLWVDQSNNVVVLTHLYSKVC